MTTAREEIIYSALTVIAETMHLSSKHEVAQRIADAILALDYAKREDVIEECAEVAESDFAIAYAIRSLATEERK